jgi:hypothetical protein
MFAGRLFEAPNELRSDAVTPRVTTALEALETDVAPCHQLSELVLIEAGVTETAYAEEQASIIHIRVKTRAIKAQ